MTRLIDAGAMDAPVAFGRMPMLAASVAQGGDDTLMCGVFGASHFQIGWFEDVDAVLDLEAARALGVQVFRRPVWGGGTAFYDTNASAIVALFVPPGRHASLDDALEAFRPSIRAALDDLGLSEAAFEGSSDVRWRGRKLGTLIAQDVLGVTVVGGFLNLRAPDLATYERIARVPPEKFADKSVDDPIAYICTPREVRGSDLGYPEFRDAVARAAGATGGLALEPSAFTAEEEAGTAGFAQTVGAEDWIKRVSSERFRAAAAPGAPVGFANLKAKKLVRAGVELGAEGRIARAMVAGDMHLSPPDSLDRIAAALAGAGAEDAERLAASILDAPGVTQPDQAAGITAADVGRCLRAAIAAARP